MSDGQSGLKSVKKCPILHLTGEKAPTAGPLFDGSTGLLFPCPENNWRWHESVNS